MGLAMAPALMAASAVTGAASSVMGGRAQERQYRAAAEAADRNAAMARRTASDTLGHGAREELKFRKQANQFAASQESALAASGAALSGSPLAVLQDTAGGIEQDAALMRYNTLREKWGFDAQAVNFGNEAGAARASAKNARNAGYIGAAASLLSGFAQLYGGGYIGAKTKGGTAELPELPRPFPKPQDALDVNEPNLFDKTFNKDSPAGPYTVGVLGTGGRGASGIPGGAMSHNQTGLDIPTGAVLDGGLPGSSGIHFSVPGAAKAASAASASAKAGNDWTGVMNWLGDTGIADAAGQGADMSTLWGIYNKNKTHRLAGWWK